MRTPLPRHFDRARLRSLFTLFLGKTYLGARAQTVECPAEHAVPVKIDVPPIPRHDKAIALFREEQIDRAALGLYIPLDLALQLPVNAP